MSEGRIRVLLADDHELARQGLRRVLELEQDLEVVGEASSAEEALELVASLSPDIVLMDIKMPTSNGLEATREIKKRGLVGEVIILSMYDEYLTQAIEAGAGGYLVKDVRREELVNTIRRVHKGEMGWLLKAYSPPLPLSRRPSGTSKRRSDSVVQACRIISLARVFPNHPP